MKKILAAFLSVLCVIMMCVSASAAETNAAIGADSTRITGERILTQEEYKEYIDSLSDEERTAMENKLAASAAPEYFSPAGAQTRTLRTLPGYVTIYQQQTSYYCVPATIQTILMYINGNSATQSTIYNTTENDASLMASYLNSKQSSCNYVFNVPGTLADMCSRLRYTIVSHQVPPSIGLYIPSPNPWYNDLYSGNSAVLNSMVGHSVVAIAIYDDNSYVHIGDPLGGYISGLPQLYSKTCQETFNSCSRIVY